MAKIRRRARRNPRNSKGRFVKRARSNPKRRARRARRVKSNPSPIKRRRRRARRVARANPVKRHRRARRLRANPVKRRRARRHLRANPVKRRRRRARRNPGAFGSGKSTAIAKRPRSAAQKRATKALVAHNKKGGKRRRRRSASMAIVARYRKAVRKAPKRSLKRRVARAQYMRASVLRRLGPKQGKSALAKAMHIKTNPGLAGLKVAAKVLLPQAAVGAVSMFGLAMAGKHLSDMITTTADPGTPAAAAAQQHGLGGLRPSFADATGAPKGIVKWMPALSTAVLAGVGYVVADKVAPRFKGAVAIGGLLGAAIQAIAAAAGAASAKGDTTSLASKAKAALGLGDYTTVGFGDYTTVGARAYAESGIFREVGDYTTVGQGQDNASEFAHDSLRGLDDASEFAPGEGGVLAGGMFRGPSSR